jgi:hypothetical protein
MKVLLILSAMLLLCGLYGKLITVLVSRSARPLVIGLQIGYAYLLVFFYGFYAVLRSAPVAVYCTLLAPALAVAIAELWRLTRYRRPPTAKVHSLSPRMKGDNLPLLVGGILVIAFAIWPYLLCGWGNYWQSGNYDIEDGLNGRDAYLKGLIFERDFDIGTVNSDRSWYDFAKTTGTLARYGNKTNSYKEIYAGDGFRLQYSSLAFWSVVFREPHGMDIFLQQALTNLLLMYAGIYFLSRRVFLMSGLASGVAAAVSVLSGFYLATFFAGHEGSLMYGSLSPAFLYLALAKPAEKLPTLATAVYLVLILAAIGFSYPQPLAILLPPVVLYRLWDVTWFREGLRRIRTFAAGRTLFYLVAAVLAATVLTLALIALWHATAGYRIRQASQYRSWGYTHDWLIVPLFLGIIPSPMEGMTFLGATLAPRVHWLLVAFAGVIAVALAACYCRFRPAANSGFFLFFGACWIPLYLLFLLFIVDGYYVYKFLYTHQYLLIIGVAGFLTTTRYRRVKFAASALLVANLVSNFVLARDIYRRPFNHYSAEMAGLLQIDRGILLRSFVEVGGGEGVVVRQTLKTHGFQTSLDPRVADYLIVSSGPESDITGPQISGAKVWGSTKLALVPASNYVIIRTSDDAESAYSDPTLRHHVFRWVGSGWNDNLGIYFLRPNWQNGPPGRYFRMCLQAGPSATSIVPVTVTAGADAVIARLELDGMRCVWIPSETVRTASKPLVVRSGVKGKSLLPHDDRILLYRVFSVGWTGERYDERAMSLFNMDEDITSPGNVAADNPVQIRLGQGWQVLETSGGTRFRWAGKSPEIVVSGAAGGGFVDITLDLEPGPSYGPMPFHLAVEDGAGRPVFLSPGISGRDTLRFRLKRPDGGSSVYVLRSGSKGLRVPNDPRELDFRVFRITCGKSGGS